ncbi:LOW QUALITY PROTEIN: receptor-type tyrosine-protein phosphatase eta [Conger conger]|uniref:LOW QUALITY PROTEIN: receptor-type tyrosine-protein phosphatase eta n=1 Tax=Conger conger TaxID=82655 RepID=UPI002A59D6E9|nr:LOW QUALITY PROTEIN: receptor-type tyrosine-protein phosphatase eta [Conger conger]
MLVFLKVSEEVLGCPKCEFKGVSSTSNINIKGKSNCNVGDNYHSTPEDNDLLVSNLNPGTSYNLTVNCSTECCNLQVTTRPDVIRNLSVTEITTSSVSLSWTEPQGKSSVYRVEWNDSSVAMNETTSQTSMNITGLTAGAQYVFSVYAVAEDNQTAGDSVSQTQYTRPDVIRNLSVTEITTSSVSLNWTEPQGKSSVYRVEWNDSSVAMNETTSQTSMNITGLTAGVQYMFRVFAVAGDNQTAGNSVNKTQYTRPDVIRNLSVTEITTSSVSLNWTEPQGKSSVYRVEWNDSSVAMNETTSQTSMNITGLTAGAQYMFRVFAVAGDNQTAGDSVNKTRYTRPDVIRNLSVTEITTSSVSLNWTEPQGKSSVYRVEWNDSSVAMNETTSQTSMNITGLTAGAQYMFRVFAVAGNNQTAGDSVYKTQYTRPDVIRNLSVTEITTSSVSLSWTEPQGKSSVYRVEWNDSSVAMNGTTSQTSMNITGLTAGAQYMFRVFAVAGDNQTAGDFVSTTQYAKPDVIRNLSVTEITTSSVYLSWTEPQGKSSVYRVEWNDSSVAMNETTSQTSMNITGLTAGAQYVFRVFAVAGDNQTAGDSVSKTQYTKPKMPSNVKAVGSTTNMTVTWSSSSGDNSSYKVKIFNSSSVLIGNRTVSSIQPVVFSNLRPGHLYIVKVIIHSGPFSASSNITNATYPNPPEAIRVEEQTTISINISWGRPVHMDPGQYNFTVFRSDHQPMTLADNWALVENLTSGTQYNISVATVGPLGYQSVPVQISATTRPQPVSNLRGKEITTSSITLIWDQPERSITPTMSGWQAPMAPRVTNVNSTSERIEKLQSGYNHTFTVTTLTADGTPASPQSISLFTRPFPVTGLNAVTQNTSTVYLSWKKPQGYQHYYTYRVETTQCTSAPKNQSENSESTYVTDLRSGSNCSFTVYSQVGNKIEGEAVSISQYTKPEKLTPSVSSHTNDSITVTWDSPSGTVERYVVNLTSSDGENSAKELSSSNQSYEFPGLMAGKIYTVKLKTVSGPFTEESEPVLNATYPNQPGPIKLKKKTTDSIAVEWGEAPGMVKGSFNYRVFYQPSANLTITQNNTIILTGLHPGTAYNISVTSLGPLSLFSLPVHNQEVTRPKKVSNLEVNSTSVDEVTLQWKASRYRYRVETANISNETSLNHYQVRNLTPGTNYTFSVRTLAFDGTEGGPRYVNVCTDAAPVTDLSCSGPNLTQAMLMLSWTKPRGANEGFQVNSNSVGQCQDSCSHNLTGLLYNEAYTVKIWTWGCGKNSAITEITCKTGITVPPVPDTADVSIGGKEYNRFTLQLKPNLFNDSNGPIKSYGVLVTSQLKSLSGENKSSLQNYLTKTYEDWTVERTTTYLAVIKDMESRNRNGDDGRVVVVGDGTKSHSYNNGPLSALGTYSFAVVIFTNLELNNGIVSVGKSFFSISEFSHEEIFLPVNPVVVGGAAGGTLAVLLILIIATVIAAIWLKRLSKKQSSEVPLYSIRLFSSIYLHVIIFMKLFLFYTFCCFCYCSFFRAKVSSPVKVENYEAYFRQHQADSNCGFAEQFENLKTVGVAQAKSSAILLENKGKNRYNNVLPYDSSRVKLSAGGSAYDDYINANYMPGYNLRKEFIAAQGPLPSTVNDFWRMIWEKNVHTLVMLTRCNEQGRVKCEKYWPSGTGHYNNITVTTTSEIPLEDWTIRDFSVKNVKTAETRTVSHFHFTAWPDHGVPETTELLINFRHLVREHMDQYSRHFPTVVHCSAGVGRTGTFIAIDRLIFQIERDSVVDVYGVVHDLRMHRPLMVQTEDQLVFLNQCALDIIRSRTGTNVDLIYQNTAALSIYENFEPMKNSQNGCNT